MSNYFLGQIMLTGFGYPQRGFAGCNGQLMSIQQNTALFSLLGTFYGGNGVTTFALPDLRGRTPAGIGTNAGNTYGQGQVVGVENVTLSQGQMPSHQHTMAAATQVGTIRDPNNTIYGASPTESLYAAPNNNLVPLVNTQVQSVGSSLPHSNMQPFSVINFNIALTGIYPSRS